MDLTEHYDTIANQMIFNFNNKTFYFIRDVSINNITVDIHIVYFRVESLLTEKISIELFNDNIVDIEGDCISLLHFEISQKMDKHSLHIFCKLALENLLDYLKTVSFDVLIGRFVPTNQSGVHLRTAALTNATRAIFNSIGLNIKDSSQECVVCYEKTFCKTACNHYLCFGCSSQIKQTSDTDSDDDDAHCPMCRTVIAYSSVGGCCSR